MKIETNRTKHEIELIVSDRVDANTSNELQQAILLNFQKMNHIIINMKNVDYISSAGLRALMIGYKTSVAKQGSFVLRHVQEMPMSVLQMSGFASMITIEQE